LVLATHNSGKLREIALLLEPFGTALVSAGELGLPEPTEDAPDFAGNARIKALAASTATGLPALADDSGFSVAALGGAPGVLSARWAGPQKDFSAAMKRIHEESGASADRRAWFTCVLCIAWPDGSCRSFQGRVDGVTVWPPRGEYGFGYDPIFIPAGKTITYGEMPADEKERDSHRGRAFRQFALAVLSNKHGSAPSLGTDPPQSR